MVNVYRYSYGPTLSEALPYNTSNAIYIGDCCSLSSGQLVSAANFTWQSAIADPASAPTVADSGGVASPGFGSGASYKVQYTYVTADGLESGPSALSTATSITATHGITASGVALAAGAVAINWYVTVAAGTGPQLVATNNGATITFTGPPPSSAPAPPAANGLSAFVLTQVSFVKQFIGVASQYYNGTNTTAIGIGDGNLRVDTQGVFLFDTVAGSFNAGALVGLDNSGSSTLMPQQVAAVSSRALAIGRVQNPTFITVGSTTRVRVQVFGTLNNINRATF